MYVGIFEEDEELVERVDGQEEVEDESRDIGAMCL